MKLGITSNQIRYPTSLEFLFCNENLDIEFRGLIRVGLDYWDLGDSGNKKGMNADQAKFQIGLYLAYRQATL